MAKSQAVEFDVERSGDVLRVAARVQYWNGGRDEPSGYIVEDVEVLGRVDEDGELRPSPFVHLDDVDDEAIEAAEAA